MKAILDQKTLSEQARAAYNHSSARIQEGRWGEAAPALRFAQTRGFRGAELSSHEALLESKGVAIKGVPSPNWPFPGGAGPLPIWFWGLVFPLLLALVPAGLFFKRRFSKVLPLLFMALSLAFGFWAWKGSSLWVVVSVASSPLRSGPGTNFAEMDQALSSSPLEVLDHREGWLQVRTQQGTTAWISETDTLPAN